MRDIILSLPIELQLQGKRYEKQPPHESKQQDHTPYREAGRRTGLMGLIKRIFH